ncbi:MAG: type IV pilus twitching motility protein PilT [Acidimicrobiia bacterium]
MVELEQLLKHLAAEGGSDLHIKPGSAPRIRVGGQLCATPFPAPRPEEVEPLAHDVLPADRRAELERNGQAEVGVSVPGLGRFRVHVHRQRGSLAVSIRLVAPGIVGLDDLGLPPQVARFADEERGLVLVSGGSGSGRSTTVAGLVDRINERRACHILTVEDPIEVLHADKLAIVTQREVGSDTPSYAEALRGATRADADVVVVGDLPDEATAVAALAVAEAGRLVVASMRGAGAAETIHRLVGVFPVDRQAQARQLLAGVLRGVVNQRLLDRADGRGRVAAVEVLVATSKVVDCVADESRHGEIDRLIAEGQYNGMRSMDDALVDLVRDGVVASRDALAAAGSSEDLRFRLSVL